MTAVNHHESEPVQPKQSAPITAIVGVLFGAIMLGMVLFSFRATLARMAERWSAEPQYSHGFLVPIFAVGLLFLKRNPSRRLDWKPAWLGLPVLAGGVGLRIFAVHSGIEPLDAFSLLPTLVGVVLLVGGWSVLRATWPAIAFLTFMLPLPFFIETSLALPLRRVATEASTYALQTCGCPALAEGNIIYIERIPLGVADACNGLGMLMTFFALATAMAMVMSGPIWERVLLVASAIPVALIANVLRITGTGLAFYYFGRDSAFATAIYHDLAGWVMMPVALLLLWLELKLIAYVTVEETETGQVPIVHARKGNFVPVH